VGTADGRLEGALETGRNDGFDVVEGPTEGILEGAEVGNAVLKPKGLTQRSKVLLLMGNKHWAKNASLATQNAPGLQHVGLATQLP